MNYYNMDTIIFNIDSRFRNKNLYPEETSFTYKLNDIIKNVYEIKISSMEIGNTSYVFSDERKNNIMYVDEFEFRIPPGNYSAEEVITLLNAWFCNNLCHLKAYIDFNTAKVSIISDAVNFYVDFPRANGNYASLGQLLGFNDINYRSSDMRLDAEKVINVLGENYYFLKVNDYGCVYNQNRKYLCKFIVDAPKYEVVYESRNLFVTKNHIFDQPIDIDKLDIKVEDLYGNIVKQNGFNYSFTIEFKIIKNETLKQYKELTFDSLELKKHLVYDKMLQYYDEKLKNKQNRTLGTIYEKILKES